MTMGIAVSGEEEKVNPDVKENQSKREPSSAQAKKTRKTRGKRVNRGLRDGSSGGATSCMFCWGVSQQSVSGCSGRRQRMRGTLLRGIKQSTEEGSHGALREDTYSVEKTKIVQGTERTEI